MRDRRRPRLLRRAIDIVVSLFALIGLAAIAGFILFATRVSEKPTTIARADAIVVLTGGSERLSDAMALLREKRAGRLLISGVHPATTTREIERIMPGTKPLLDCCVDLDYQALNTAGNALATKVWVESHGYGSVILVTSGWHMPRAQTELARSLPGVSIVPYPVVTDHFRDGTWWRDSETLTMVFGEYVKYVAALANVRIAPRLAGPPADLARTDAL